MKFNKTINHNEAKLLKIPFLWGSIVCYESSVYWFYDKSGSYLYRMQDGSFVNGLTSLVQDECTVNHLDYIKASSPIGEIL